MPGISLIRSAESPDPKISLRLESLAKEMVKQLKINNEILNEVHDLTVNEGDIK